MLPTPNFVRVNAFVLLKNNNKNNNKIIKNMLLIDGSFF